jgi:REP element-mobilizing transposase RayT
MRSSLSTSSQSDSAFQYCTRGLRVGFTIPNSCSGLCFRRCLSLVAGVKAGWHSRRDSSNGSETAAFVFWTCTAQSVERSSILARPSTRLSTDKRCYLEAQKTNKAYRDLQELLLYQIRQEYAKTPKARASRGKYLPLKAMPRTPRLLPQGYSFHITFRCNSRQFLIAKGLRRDVLLAVLAMAQAKVPHRLNGLCMMANHQHLLIRPDDASQLPRLMHWFGWYSAMALNRLSGRCGHFWEARYYATAIAPKDHRRVRNTLRYIHANLKAAGIRKGFYDPYSNYGHYGRLEADGISEWHPSFL